MGIQYAHTSQVPCLCFWTGWITGLGDVSGREAEKEAGWEGSIWRWDGVCWTSFCLRMRVYILKKAQILKGRGNEGGVKKAEAVMGLVV